MNDFRTKLTLDGSDFSRQMDDAASSVNQFQKQTDDASKTVDDMGKATKRTASELLKQMKSMEGGARSVSNYRQQLGQMQRQIQDLTINYRAMSNEMKQSEFGKEVAAQIQELTKQASEYKDAIGDATQATKLLASDTANLDAAKSAIEGLSAGMQLFASAGILGEENTEKVVKALAKLKAIESATNAVIKISNILNKDSILMLKLKDLQTKAATRATLAHAAATGKATIAQRTFNTVAKSNPYVLLATAILAVVGALVAFDRYCGEAEDAQDDLNKELKEGVDLNKTYRDSFNNSFVPLLTTFKKLQTGWKNLKTELEKTEYIKKNAEEFKKLGVEVNGVHQAEDILVNNSELFIKTLTLRAKAAAAAAVAMEGYKEASNIDMKGFDKLPKAGDVVPAGTPNPARYGLAWDHMEADGMHNDYRFTQAGADQYIIENKLATAYVNKQKAIDKANKALQDEVNIETELADLMKNFSSGTSTTTSTSSKETYDAGSIAAYDAAIQKLNDSLKNKNLTDEQTLKIQREIVRLEQQRAKLAKEQENAYIMAGTVPTLKPVSTKKAMEDLTKKLSKDPVKVPATFEVDEDFTFSDFNKEIGSGISGLNSINSSIKSVYDTWSKLSDSLSEQNGFESMLTIIGAVLSTLQSICSVIETINTLTEIMNQLGMMSYLTQQKKNAATVAGLAPEAMAVTLAEKEATAASVGAAAEGGKSVAKIPYVGAFLAIAMIAAILGSLIAAKSSMKFASGGIVPGSSFSGDNITAQLNSGEMVLNTQQQARLFDMLNGNSPYMTSNNVRFEIEGQKLVGVIDNYNRKLSHI